MIEELVNNGDEIGLLFEEWNRAIQSGDPTNVTELYEADGILLPTCSNKVRHGHAEINSYFVDFCSKKPVGKIDESNIRTFDQIAINSGLYSFSFASGNVAKARFTFVYRWNGKRWMIVEHHSSLMPE